MGVGSQRVARESPRPQERLRCDRVPDILLFANQALSNSTTTGWMNACVVDLLEADA